MAENGEHAKVKVTGQGRDMTVQHVPHKADSVWDGLGLRDVTPPPSPVSHTHTTRRREREGFRGVGRGVHDRCCDDTWVDFTADTSLHGLKYIWMRDIFLLRRLLWLTMTLACSAIMMYQIVDRIIYFAAMPVTVDVRVNFNTSLHFPAITICNQNTFRASQAARLGLYELLTDLHDDLDPVNSSELVQYGASNLSMATLYSATKHTLHDLLLRCERRGVLCGADDFELVATDHGMCYTLDTSNFTVNSAGAEDGLSLTLNVEQYEYMPGPHDAAGIKMLLHDSKESPNVHALGQALSAGVHSFLAMKLVSVKNLPSPHGECDSPSLRYYPHYATANCETECRASLLARLCGCRLVYMPGDVPICTLWQYYGCYMPKKNTLRWMERSECYSPIPCSFYVFDRDLLQTHYVGWRDTLRGMERSECYCPIPCSFYVYDPVMSYADASPLAVEWFLTDANQTALAASYHRAREVTHRLQKEKRQHFLDRLDSLESHFYTLRHVALTDIGVRLTRQREGLTRMWRHVQGVQNVTRYLFQYQQYVTDKDFVRAADAMRERTFGVVAAAMQEFVHRVESKVKLLADPSVTDPSVRQALYLLTVTEVESKMDIARRALDNYSQLYDAVQSGTPIFNYKFRGEPRSHSVDIVPLPLFQLALRRTGKIRVRSRRVKPDLQDVLSNLTLYRAITVEAFQSGTLNVTAMWTANVFFLKACREYLQSIDMFLNDAVKYTATFLEKRMARFNSEWRDFTSSRDSLLRQMDTLTSLAQSLQEGILTTIQRALRLSRVYLTDGSPTKRDIARLFVSSKVQLGQSDLRKFFAELRVRGQEVHDLWGQLERDGERLVNSSLTDPNLHTYYTRHQVWDHLGGLHQALASMRDQYDQCRADDIRDAIQNYDDELLTSLGAMVADMQDFLDTGEVDANFVRNNFLRLNVFYRELNYEQITQQEAYNIFALLCDIGGSMGLFLGASVLTIFELLDLFVFQYFKAR